MRYFLNIVPAVSDTTRGIRPVSWRYEYVAKEKVAPLRTVRELVHENLRWRVPIHQADHP